MGLHLRVFVLILLRMNGKIYMNCGQEEVVVFVDIPIEVNDEGYKGAAFYVKRSGNPRISSVEFSDFPYL